MALRTHSATDRAMRPVAKLGFEEVERIEGYGTEQWFGGSNSGAS
nr:hypothetical protein [Nocardia panacis]